MPDHPAAAAAGGLLVVLALTSCAADPTDPGTAGDGSTAVTSATLTTQEPDPSSAGSAPTTAPVVPDAALPGAGAAHEAPVDPDAVVDLDPAAGELAASAAVTFMRAFGRPDLPEQQWWAGLEQLLTPAGAQAYAYVDPAQVPFDQVEPDAVLQADSTPVLARVVVATSAGDYTVTLERAGDAAWLVDRITPPS